MPDIAHIRREYEGPVLRETDVAADPVEQFARWMQDAIAHPEVYEPNAMTLATATPDGRPSARVVLLKDVDAAGFVFYTNYESRKGAELEQNPHAALLFYWDRLSRQVRVEGTVEMISCEESAAYFHARPRDSQIGAWASHQSRTLESRAELEAAFQAAASRFQDAERVELPAFWGGYRIRPTEIEFWQGQENRLHDRIRYALQPNRSWRIERLAP